MKTILRLIVAACLCVTTALAQNQLATNLTVTNHEIVGSAAGAVPVTELEVDSVSTASPRGILSAQYTTDALGARLGFRKARGTRASPTTIVTGDNLGRLNAWPYDGTSYLEMSSIIFGAEGTVATNRVPTNIQFWTATDASPSVLTERLRIDSAGNFTASAGAWLLNGATGGMPGAGSINAKGFLIDGVPVGTSTSSYWNAGTGNINYLTNGISLTGDTATAAGAVRANQVISAAAHALDLAASGNVTINTTNGATLAATFSGANTTLAGTLNLIDGNTSLSSAGAGQWAFQSTTTNALFYFRISASATNVAQFGVSAGNTYFDYLGGLNIRTGVGGSTMLSLAGTTGVATFGATTSGTSTTAAAILGKSMGLTENLWVGGTGNFAGTLTLGVNTLSTSGANLIIGSNGATRLDIDHGNTGWTRLQIIPQQSIIDIDAILNNASTAQLLRLNNSGGAITTGAGLLTVGGNLTVSGTGTFNGDTLTLNASGFTNPIAAVNRLYASQSCEFRLTSAGTVLWKFYTPGTTTDLRINNGTNDLLTFTAAGAANFSSSVSTVSITATTASTSTTTGACVISGGAGIAGAVNLGTYLATGAPAGSTSGQWKFGAANTVNPTSPNRTLAVDIGGTVYYIAAKTTND